MASHSTLSLRYRNNLQATEGGCIISRGSILIILMLAFSIPVIFLRLGGIHLEPIVSALIFGIGILASAALLSWASEVAEMDMGQGLVLAIVALIAVLPEYAVDGYFAWQAGQDPDGKYVQYATANMTGANRLLIGLGWSGVVILYWIRRRQQLVINKPIHIEMIFLIGATLLAFIMPVQKEIALWMSGILVLIFVVYMWQQSKSEAEEPHLFGPAATIGSLPTSRRRAVIVILFIYSAITILLAAEPFAEGLIDVGKNLAISEFILIQWVAPLASEAPEMIIALILVSRGNAIGALILLISSKINQWTLLVGTLPVIYSFSLGEASGIPLDSRQGGEILLTAAQSLFAVVLLVNKRIGITGALFLLILFITQPLFTDLTARYIYSFIYLVLVGIIFIIQKQRLIEIRNMAIETAKDLKSSIKLPGI